MKTFLPLRNSSWLGILTLAGLVAFGQVGLQADEGLNLDSALAMTRVGGHSHAHPAPANKSIQAADAKKLAPPCDVTWLGVSTEEASEALSAQLGLHAGMGLVVTDVASNSPAALAGLEKNDVLTQFEGQTLVLPEQLQKLVQMRKSGDVVKLVLFRAGKKRTVSATLGKAATSQGLLGDARAWENELRAFQDRLRESPLAEAIRDQMNALRRSLEHVHIDQKKVEEQIRRSMDEARRALDKAFHQATNAMAPTSKAFEDLFRSGATAQKKRLGDRGKRGPVGEEHRPN